MSTPPFLPAPRTDLRNGAKNGSAKDEPAMSPGKGPNFLAPFLGAFAAVFVLALVVGGIYLGTRVAKGPTVRPANSPLQNVALWQEGPVTEGSLAEPVKPDIGWWTQTFTLPKLNEQVSEYLSGQGLKVDSIEPVHYTDNPDAAVLTYQVTVSVPGELYRVPEAQWMPNNPDEARFSKILVLNDGLPPGTYWNTQNAKVEAAANVQRTTLFNVRWNKASNTVTADRLLPHDLVNQEQVTQYRAQTQQVMASLNERIQQIDVQVQKETQALLAQVPPDPPKPTPQTAHFGGDGSGEPTKSAARIGGGAAAGAAGGALFGAAAGNAGMGAGIGAGVGLLSGIIYNAVSKSNDKEKLERQVADENAEALDNWRAQIKSLKQQRAQIAKEAPEEKETALNNLANQIVANQGHLEAGGTTPVNPPEPNSAQPSGPTSAQPTGPIQSP
jgi:hypothetical protein